MKIDVNRNLRDDGCLVFEIVVSEPHKIVFSPEDFEAMHLLSSIKNSMEGKADPESNCFITFTAGIHDIQERIFEKFLRTLRSTIDNELYARIKHIFQEIYNWISDQQKDELKKWMFEFDPQRSRYYFSNDTNIEKEDLDE